MSRCCKNFKVKNACIRNLNALDANITNLNVKKINGRDLNCLLGHNNISGVIDPVKYINGEPQQPTNDGTFNQKVLDELWNLNKLTINITNLDAAYGRLKNNIISNFYNCTICPLDNLNNCKCPISTYSVFTGSINGNVLTISGILNESYTSCPSNQGVVKIGQRIYGKTYSFLNSIIVNQISGTNGGIGSYTIKNNFDDYSQNVSQQTILSISDNGIEECAAVPLRIYGIETLSVGPSGPCELLVETLAYNLNIANKTLNSKLAAVYVQVGYLNTNDEVQIQGLVIDTRQFDASILSFGEQMNNTILLSTDLVERIARYNILKGLSVSSSLIQLVVYVEDGLEVLISNSIPLLEFGINLDINTPTYPNNNYSISLATVGSTCRTVGTVSTFIQPNVGGTVVIPTGGFDGQFVNRDISYIKNGGFYKFGFATNIGLPLFYVGDISSTSAAPGTKVESEKDNVSTCSFVGYVNDVRGENLKGTFTLPGFVWAYGNLTASGNYVYMESVSDGIYFFAKVVQAFRINPTFEFISGTVRPAFIDQLQTFLIST